MLKNRIKSLALVTAILLNVAAVSVNAKHSVTSIEDVTTNLLNESFDAMTYNQTGYKHHDEEAELTGTGLGIKQSWNTATITKGTEEGNNYLSQIVDINKTNLYFNPSNSVQLKKGDKIKLTFDFRQNDAEAKFTMKLKGNNTATYTHVDGNSLSNGNQDGIILSKIRCRIVPGYLDYGDSNYYTLGEWCSATITIDTCDEEMDNSQSLKVVLVDDKKPATRTYYGKLDADGDSSNGVTALTSFDGFEFTTEPKKYDAENADNCVPTKLDLDDIVVEHITQEEVVTWISDLSSTIIDENFDDYATSNQKIAQANTDYVDFWDNSNISYKKYKTWSSPGFYVTDTGKEGNAFQVKVNDGMSIKFKNPAGTTSVAEGDIIHINYDFFHNIDEAGYMYVNLNENASGTFKILDYSEEHWIKDCSNESFASNPGRPGIANMFFPKSTLAFYDFYGGLSLVSDGWTNVDIIINTKDSRYDNKQTVKITSGDKYILGAYDANYTGSEDVTTDRFTEITSLLFDTTKDGYGNTRIKLDNVKLEVIKPGVEVYGTSVDNCEAGKFVNGGLTVKAAIGTSYPGASQELNILVAKYNGDKRLIDVEPVSKTISGGDCIIDLDDEISITSDVQTIKLFAWDLNNVTPYMDATVLTRAE